MTRAVVTMNRRAEMLRRTRAAARAVNLDAALSAAKVARASAPVDTGALRDSIKAEAKPDGSAEYSAGGPSAPYARKVNYGTVFQAPQPFYTQGHEAGRREIRRSAERRLRGRR